MAGHAGRSAAHRMVCWSISCSDSGLLPPDTTERSRCRMWMKSLAEMVPQMAPVSESHSGADAMPAKGRKGGVGMWVCGRSVCGCVLGDGVSESHSGAEVMPDPPVSGVRVNSG